MCIRPGGGRGTLDTSSPSVRQPPRCLPLTDRLATAASPDNDAAAEAAHPCRAKANSSNCSLCKWAVTAVSLCFCVLAEPRSVVLYWSHGTTCWRWSGKSRKWFAAHFLQLRDQRNYYFTTVMPLGASLIGIAGISRHVSAHVGCSGCLMLDLDHRVSCKHLRWLPMTWSSECSLEVEITSAEIFVVQYSHIGHLII